MNGGNKPASIKQRMREEKKRERRIGIIVTVAVLIAIVLVSGFLINSMLKKPSGGQTGAGQLKAVIVDQMSLTYPNQTFVENATSLLERAGYAVDYYSGDEVSVGFYKNLMTYGYSVVILRVHSTTSNWGVTLFTAEPYSRSAYLGEQLIDAVVPVAYSAEEASRGKLYFGINPSFIEADMTGDFSGAVVIAMGCNGLNNTKMARVFIKEGAKAYVGWDYSVSSSHTDQATLCLLQHLITQRETIKNAVDDTMKEVGPDPACGSQLIYYPPEAGEQTTENSHGKS
jgi:hypothetical protein